MLALERKNIIIERLAQDGKVIVATLSEEFNVSKETIRRDIEQLELEGTATKTYGGAVFNGHSQNRDLPYAIRKNSNIESKQKIAATVASLIKEGDQIMLDASSTSIYVVRALKQMNHLTVITNSIEILLELADKPGWTILSTGGTLREGAYSLSGSSAEEMVANHHVDFAICSAKGLDANMGITESNERDATMKRALYNAANTKILAIDSSKIDKISFTKVCDIGSVDIIVTETNPGENWKKRIQQAGVTLLINGEKYEGFGN